MPVTPLHLGPGLALKGIAGRHFSFTVFGFSQVLIDIEPAVRFFRGDAELHGPTHTYAGATVVAIVALVLGRPACRWLLRYWDPDPRSPALAWLPTARDIPWPAAAAGAFAGTWSHVLLDSVMHADMRPFAPWSQSNALLAVLSTDGIHALCGLSALAGLALLYLLSRRRGS